MRLRAVLIVALGLAIGGLAAWIMVSQAPPGQVTTGTALVGGPFSLIAGALDKLGAKADTLAPIFITLAAARDTPAKTGAYAKSFSPKLTGLSGTPEEVAAAAKAYRVYFKKEPGNDSANYNIDHTSIIYLMDEAGQYVAHFPYPITVDELAAKLAERL